MRAFQPVIFGMGQLDREACLRTLSDMSSWFAGYVRAACGR